MIPARETPGGRPVPPAVHVDLQVEGPGLRGRLVGEGGPMRLLLTAGSGAQVPRTQVRALAETLDRAGLTLEVHDSVGRRLLITGSGVRSRIGRILVGSARARPTPRALLARMRRR